MRLMRRKVKENEVDLEGSGKRRMRPVLAVLGVVLAVAVFSSFFYKQTFVGLVDRNALETAGVARNISTGRGFTTNMVRPSNLSFFSGKLPPYPEVNQAPLYPYIVGSAFKVRGPSDQTAIQVSMLFFLLCAAASIWLGYLLFDLRAGLLAAGALGVSSKALSVVVSGQEWSLAAFLFTLLLCVAALHHGCAASGRGPVRVALIVASAALTGALYATSYVLVCLVVPVAMYIAFTERKRWILNLAIFLVAFTIFASPLVYRNYSLTGSPLLGAATWDIMANTAMYPGDTLYRTLEGTGNGLVHVIRFAVEQFPVLAGKVLRGMSSNLLDLALMPGLLAFGLVSVAVLYRFRSPQANAVRGLLYGVVPVVLASAALFSEPSAAALLLAPAVAVLGSAYLLLLLDAKKLHIVYYRGLVGGFLILTAMPAVTSSLWRSDDLITPQDAKVHAYLTMLPVHGLLYTDVPWIACWRTKNLVVWVPYMDSDLTAIEALDMRIERSAIILTGQSDRHGNDDIWKALHTIMWWRHYLEDPKLATKTFTESLKQFNELSVEKIPDPPTAANRFISLSRRKFTISMDRIVELRELNHDPMNPDDIQALIPVFWVEQLRAEAKEKREDR